MGKGNGVNLGKPVSLRRQPDRGAVDTGGYRVALSTVAGAPLVERTPDGDVRAWQEGRAVEGRQIG